MLSKHNIPLRLKKQTKRNRKHTHTLSVVMSWNSPYISQQLRKIPGRGCTQITQVKKQLTAGPHLLVVTNQGKPFKKRYKMSPQADALSVRIMGFSAAWEGEHILPCLYNSELSLRGPYLSPLPFDTGSMPCPTCIHEGVTAARQPCRSRFMNSGFCPLDLDTHCQGCSGNGAQPAGQSLGPGARARARPAPPRGSAGGRSGEGTRACSPGRASRVRTWRF